MEKQSGLGDNFYISGYDLSGDVSAIDKISGGPALLDFTSINKFAYVRQGGLRDGGFSFTTLFEFGGTLTPDFEHDVLSQLPRSDAIACYFRGALLGSPAAGLVSKQSNYDGTRDNSGNFNFKADLVANAFGMEWGTQLTSGLRTDTTATAGTDSDNGASTAFGAQAYLQVNAFTGTGVDIKVEHSSDGTTWTTLIDFGTVAGRSALRGAVTGTVNQHVRVTTGTGTFTSVTFAAMIVRNLTAVKF